MQENKRTLPMSVQDFEKLREANCIYVDKTEYIYTLVHDVAQFFLSRPRRFGKSLLLSTMKAYWEGKKELFSGLAIEKLESENKDAWQPHPVFYFDFNGTNYHEEGALETVLDSHLTRWEEIYLVKNIGKTLSIRFQNLLMTAYQQTGRRCVVLVDEYDKPLLDLIDVPELLEHNKAVFKGFFSNLKNCDAYVRFVFITGVTKFHKVSIFSDLNQLNDISLNEDFSGICGITDEELREYFAPEILAIAKKRKISEEECLQTLKIQYDGYRFHQDGTNVYNPYSLIKAFYDKEFGSYWFETGTPTFLVEKLRNDHFDVRKFSNQTIFSTERTLKDYTGDTLDPIPLLYQSGYLTISDYNPKMRRYVLAFPNDEVRYAFLESLVPVYIPKANAANGLDIFTLVEYVENGDLEGIRNVLTGLFANISYTTNDPVFEHYFQTVIYVVFTLLGRYVVTEQQTYKGRIDCKVETDRFIYLFEYKLDKTAEEALKQIDTKDYKLSFVANKRKLFKIGVSFDSKERKLADWKVAE